jgi:hypothetical protein
MLVRTSVLTLVAMRREVQDQVAVQPAGSFYEWFDFAGSM